MRGVSANLSEPLELYHGCNPQPPYTFDDLTQFKVDIAAKIDAIFDDGVRQVVLNQLLAKVSIANEVTFDHSARRVLLPLSLGELKASKDSMLTISFESAGGRGELQFQPWAQLGTGVHCRFVEFVVPPDIAVQQAPFFWHDTFSSVFPADQLPEMSVFMTVYIAEPFAGLFAAGGLVGEP